MSKETQNSTESQEETEALRKAAVEECSRFCDLIIPQLDTMKAEAESLQSVIMIVNESRMTWLERLATILDVDVRRGVFSNEIGLYWADVEGNILRDDETGQPMHEIVTPADIQKLTTTRDGAIKLATAMAAIDSEVQ